MNKFLSKIAGFTLSEVLVSLAIGSILFGIIYTAINLVTANIESIKNNYIQRDGLQLAEQQLTLDFNSLPEIRYSEFERKLTFSSPIDSVQYQFENKYVIRNVDTLDVVLHDKKFFFNGNKVEQGMVDAIQLFCLKGKDTISLFVFKQNDLYSKLNNGN